MKLLFFIFRTGDGDLTIVDDHGEGIVVRLLVPAGEVILVVCHLAVD